MILLLKDGRVFLAKTPPFECAKRDYCLMLEGKEKGQVGWAFPNEKGEFNADFEHLGKDNYRFMRRVELETSGMPTTVTVYREEKGPDHLKTYDERLWPENEV